MKKISNKLFKKEISKSGLIMTLGGKLAYTGTGCYISNISQSYDCGDKDADAPTVGV